MTPIGAMATAGRQVFELVGKLRSELGVNTTYGASNIMNLVRPQEMEATCAANLLSNNHPLGAEWIKANKPPVSDGEVEAGARTPGRVSAAKG